MFFAHSTDRTDRSDWQPLPEHLKRVGCRAAEIAAKFRAASAALLAGLAHDLGKYSLPFQARLSGATARVDHSAAGAREVTNAARSALAMSARIAEIVAYAIAGHHAGLPDRHGGQGSLHDRLEVATIPDLDPVWRSEVQLGSPGVADLERHPNEGRYPFQLAFLGRMIFSALVDADRRDTERHAVETGHEPAKPRDWPCLSERAGGLIAAVDAHLDGLAARGGDPQLNAIRRRVLDAVKARTGDPCGLFTLTVPTGGGKTLTVTRFALGHARDHGLDRLVYAIPFAGARIETT